MPSMQTTKESFGAFVNKTASFFNLCIRLLPVIMGAIVMISSLSITFTRFSFTFAGLIVGFYMILGGIVFHLIEKNNDMLFCNFPCLQNETHKAIFYIMVGSCPLIVTGVNDVLGVFLLISGLIIILKGIYIIFRARQEKIKGNTDYLVVADVEFATESAGLYPDTSLLDDDIPRQEDLPEVKTEISSFDV